MLVELLDKSVGAGLRVPKKFDKPPEVDAAVGAEGVWPNLNNGCCWFTLKLEEEVFPKRLVLVAESAFLVGVGVGVVAAVAAVAELLPNRMNGFS